MIHIQRKQLPVQHSYRSDGPALVDHNKAWSLCMLADINLLIQNKYTDNETSDGAFIWGSIYITTISFSPRFREYCRRILISPDRVLESWY